MLMLWLQILGLITGFIVPILTQHESIRKIISICAGGLYATGLSLILVGRSLPIMIVGCGFCGLASGASFSYALTLISLNGSTPEETTWLSGFAQMVGYAMASIGPFLLGALFDLSSSWTAPLITVIIFSLFMLVVGIFAGHEGKNENLMKA